MPSEIETVENDFQPSPDGKCSEAQGGMVATAFPEATRAGVEMLRRGGNAVDAACAAALALCVCEPQACGLGGHTMAILHVDRKTFALEGSGRAPARLDPTRVGEADLRLGYKATTVPSTPAVLGRMHSRFGRLDWASVVQPAINIAHQGYRITGLQRDLQQRELDGFAGVASGSGGQVILKDGAKPYAAGDLFRQPRLAALLETLAKRGVTAFYTGRVARIIDADMQANGGFLGLEDLGDIPWPVERPAIHTGYRSYVIASLPPPAAGRALLLVFRMLKRFYPTMPDKNKPEVLAVLINTLRAVITANRRNPLSPRDYRPAVDAFLSDEPWLLRIMADIRAGSYPCDGRPASEKTLGETTHLSVMDADGNAVGLTQSVNLVYGSKAACPALGIVYNNYLLDTERRDPKHPHYLKPGAIPQSYACPTIVFHDGRPWMVTGSPGSERIISVVTQFLVHVIDHQRPICEAMRWPRFHYAPEGILSLEYDRFDPAVREYLEGIEAPIERREPYAFYLGAIHAVLKRQCGGGFQGVAEIRRDGIAAGFDP